MRIIVHHYKDPYQTNIKHPGLNGKYKTVFCSWLKWSLFQEVELRRIQDNDGEVEDAGDGHVGCFVLLKMGSSGAFCGSF